MVDPDRLRDELRRMKQLIATNPKVLARFDKDGNGVIDGDEWEEVRQLVIRRLEREEAERTEAQALLQEAREAGADVSGFERSEEAAGALAQNVFEQHVRAPRSAPEGSSRGPAVVASLNEFVLEQRVGLGSLMEGVVRREYCIRDLAGVELATLTESTSDLARSVEFRPMGGHRNTGFNGVEHATGSSFGVSLVWHLIGCELRVAGGPVSASVTSVAHLLGRKFEVQAAGDPTALYVTRPLLRPFTLRLADPFDEPLGECHRGWVGLGGFLSGANRTRIEVDPRVSPGVRWALVALSLYLDVSASRSNR